MRLINPLVSTNPRLAPGPGVPYKKVYPWGVPPKVSSRSQYPHVMSPHQSAPLVDSLNHVAHPVWAHSTLFSCTGQDGELTAVDCAVLRATRDPVCMLKELHNLPMGKECLPALFRRCTHEELRDWAKTLPWDHPVAWSLDHEVHRRRIAGESHFCFFPLPRYGFPHIPFFS